MGLQFRFEEVSGVAAGILMLAVAAWLTCLNGRSRVTRVFALFVALRGIYYVLAATQAGATQAGNYAAWSALLPFVLIFGVTYVPAGL